MRELNVSNAIRGDRTALAERWEKDGYWFFRDVLDHQAIAALRSLYLRALAELGVVEAGAQQPLWNGAELKQVPTQFMAALRNISPWRAFVETPVINAAFTTLLDDAPYWLPMVEYRATPPQQASSERFNFVHQDGYFYNSALPCLNCWIPLAEIDEPTGGIALVEGGHKRGYLHNPNLPPLYDIDKKTIPEDAWRRSDYRPGDLLLFDMRTPHSGLTNRSDRYFRLSIDLRVMPASGHRPIVGQIVAVSPDSITLRQGTTVTFNIDDETYVRTVDSGERLERKDIGKYWRAGDTAIVAFQRARATLIRPPHN